MKKKFALICMLSFIANSAFAVAFSGICWHKSQALVQEKEILMQNELVSHGQEEPCHHVSDAEQNDTQLCERNCFCAHATSNISLLNLDLSHSIRLIDPTELNFQFSEEIPASVGHAPPKRPPKDIS